MIDSLSLDVNNSLTEEQKLIISQLLPVCFHRFYTGRSAHRFNSAAQRFFHSHYTCYDLHITHTAHIYRKQLRNNQFLPINEQVFSSIDEEMKEAEQELADGKQEIYDGQAELADATESSQ